MIMCRFHLRRILFFFFDCHRKDGAGNAHLRIIAEAGHTVGGYQQYKMCKALKADKQFVARILIEA